MSSQPTNKENQIVILSDGRKMGYAEYGDPNGKPLLFFHGWPMSRLQAKLIDKEAKEFHIRILSLDRPGYGLSDYKEGRTILDWVDDVDEFVRILKIDKFSVLGQSGGGPYALACAYKIPERILDTIIVSGLAPPYIPELLSGMFPINKFGWNNLSKIPLLAELAAGIQFIESKSSFKKLLPLYRSKQEIETIGPLFREIIIIRREAFKEGFRGSALDLKLYASDWGFKVKDIHKKVYLWYGGDDKFVPIAMGQYYESEIKNSKLTIFPHEGHAIIINHAKEILSELV